ncbi:MAG: amidohydrolase family protein [Chitinophagaceae bacterium]|nr:amidohydrolase family protein [Chitinophagaceae bacterium]
MKFTLSFLLLTGGVLDIQYAFSASSDTLFYNYVNSGKIVGTQWVWQKGKGDYYYYDEYNDRGRGPSLHTHITTGAGGVILSEDISGVDYYKSPVRERFYVRRGKAYWKNKFENDSTAFKNELYSDINGPLAVAELVLKMLQTAPAGEIHVLPAGTRNFKLIASTAITEKGSQRRHTLRLMAFSGYGGPPGYLWFTSEGRFFGSLSDWSSLIQKGFEDYARELYVLQQQYEAKFYTDLARRLTEHPDVGIAIRNTTVFDTRTGDTLAHQTVLISKGKIERLGSAAGVSVPAGYKVIDGSGKFLMPGLWEMHGHFSKEQGPFMLAQGVTNLRDMGNSFELLHTRQLIREDSLLGPDVTVISGFIDKAGEFAAPTGVLIKSLDEGLKAIEDYKEKGYDQIKLYSSIEPGWVKPLADKAHSLGMRVCGHIPAFMTASQAVDAGYDEVTHINMLLLNFFGDTVDTRSMGRFFLPGRKGYTIDVKGPAAQNFIRQLKEKHIVFDPTLCVFEEMYVDLPGQISGKYAPIAAYLPAEVKRGAMTGGFIDKDSLIGVYARSFANMESMLKELFDNGLTILSGTDGGILQHELELYSQSGIPNAEVLKMATWYPAKVSGKDGLLGSIEENKVANLVLIDGNPLRNMQDIRRIYVTIKGGEIYSPKAIYGEFGWRYY